MSYKCYLNPVLDKFYTSRISLDNGNCLFNCLQMAIPELDQSDIIAARKQICDELKTTIDKILLKFTSEQINEYHDHGFPIHDGPTIDKYIDYMRQDKTFGTSTEILAAQLKFGKNICIYTMQGDLETSYETLKSQVLTNYNDDTKCDIILYYCSDRLGNRGTHYELLIPKMGTMPTKDTIRYAVNDARSVETGNKLLAQDKEAQDDRRRREEEANEILARELEEGEKHAQVEQDDRRRREEEANEILARELDEAEKIALAERRRLEEDNKIAAHELEEAEKLAQVEQDERRRLEKEASEKLARELDEAEKIALAERRRLEEDNKIAAHELEEAEKLKKDLRDNGHDEAYIKAIMGNYYYKYLKYKTKYLTLKKNTNLLYK